jgi:RNA polymerase sigma-70 factor, ECF subfamily
MENYDIFYKSSKDGLFAYLLRMTGDYHLACDLVQESFLRYLRRYSNKGPNSRSLLYTIARNAAMDAFRKPKTDSFDPDGHPDHRNNPEQQLDDRQTFDKLMVAIHQLSIKDRELISLIAGADLSYVEIGKILDLSVANVKVKVHRARLRLKEILSNGGN